MLKINYRSVIIRVLSSNHYYEKDETNILDMTPLQLNNPTNCHRTVFGKLSIIKAFATHKQTHEQREIHFINAYSTSHPFYKTQSITIGE